MERLPLVILVDVDNTVNQLTETFISFLKARKVQYTEPVLDYDLRSIIQDKNKNKIFREIMTDNKFWESIPLLPYAQEAIESLNTLCYVYIVTVPFNKETAQTKFNTILSYFPFLQYRQILFYEQKWKLKGDVIIEDKPPTLEKCAQEDFITVKKVQSYNASVPAHFDISDWKEYRVFFPKILTHAMEKKHFLQ